MKSFLLFISVISILAYFLIFFGNPKINTPKDTNISSASLDKKEKILPHKNIDLPYKIENVYYMKLVYSSLIEYYKLIFKNNKIQRDLFAVEIKNYSNFSIKVFIDIDIEDVSYPNQKIITIAPNSLDTISVSPQLIPSYLINIYEKQLKTMNVSVKIKTKDSTYSALDKKIPITFLPVNNMKYSIYDKILKKNIDLRPLLVAYVNPSFFEIDEILRLVSKKNGNQFLAGYQEISSKTKREIVLKQIESIYYALKDLEISYVSNPVDYSGDQKIKTPSEIFKYQSANCIEGVILFASIIEALGMKPLIVLVPGHAFVGWKIWDDTNSADFLETTMIWNVNNPNFQTALAAGKEEFASATDEGQFKTGKSIVLDVVQLRGIGVLPIAVDNSEFQTF